MTSLKLQIRFTSDWHIGAGSGRPGDVDRLIRRDHNGLPFVPAKSMTGIWRDAAETLANNLMDCDHAQGNFWHDWVIALFGSQPSIQRNKAVHPVAARLRIGDASLPESIRAAVAGCPALARGLTYVAPSVSIDPDTGAAKEEQFFLVEYARQGAQLEADVTVDDTAEGQRDTALRFLTAAAEGIRAIGGKRRRGRGECEVRVSVGGAVIDDATGAFFARLADAQPPSEIEAEKTDAKAATTPEAPWREWVLRVQAQEPLLAHNNTTGNVVSTLDHIPGGLLLAALGGALRRHSGNDLFADIAAGDLQIRNAYPVLAGSEPGHGRAIPTPMCLFRAKRASELISRLAKSADPNDTTQWKQLRKGYVPAAPPTEQPLTVTQTRLQVTTHNVIADDIQTPTEEVGGVYTYEAIAPSQQFESKISVREGSPLDDLLQAWQSRGEPVSATLGKARHAGYGRVSLQPVVVPAETPVASDDGRLVLWLGSTLLGLSDSLTPVPQAEAVVREVGDVLGCDVGLIESDCWLRATRRESWHRGWRLPRPSLAGWQAGSVLVMQADNPDAQALERLARRGLGQRRAEGFGEIVVNPTWLHSPPTTVEIASAATRTSSREPRPADIVALRKHPFGVLVLTLAARAEIEELIAALAPPKQWLGQDDSAAPISALRVAVAAAAEGKVCDSIDAFIATRDASLLNPVRALSRDADTKSAYARLFADRSDHWIDEALWSELRDDAVRSLVMSWCQWSQRSRAATAKGRS